MIAQRRIATRAVKNPVFAVSALVIIAFVGATALFPAAAAAAFSAVLDFIATTFGWFYVLSVAVFLGFALWLIVSRYANIRLGDDSARPEYGIVPWFAMLFSAGMGIGIVFFGVAEPMLHFTAPPTGEAGTRDAAKLAMTITFFHWGPHAWAIYVVLGLALAYFSFRRGLPLSTRSALYPLIGDRIYGPLGHLVDILAVFGTVFGLATSLGLGAMQINAGLVRLFGVSSTTGTQLVIIAAITLAATASLLSGLDRGIRRLSELNLLLAFALMLFVFVTGPSLFLLNSLSDNIGQYLRSFVPRTFWTAPFANSDWHKSWTLFYWGWWISWAPFVGTFIARISKGRTVREFVLGAMLAPTLATFVWMTVFGGTSLHFELFGGGGIAKAVSQDLSTAIYVLLERLPFSGFSSLLAALVVALFFVTSSDSGSFVVDMLTTGGHPNPPAWTRVFWALTEGAVAASLLVVGGLKGLQSAAISTGLPFCAILLLVCVGLVRALRADPALIATRSAAAPAIGGDVRPEIRRPPDPSSAKSSGKSPAVLEEK
jgi:choline/glycine/proline betaine transport protein